jgi:outer membrane receptor protein involved in Fe transport
LTSWLQATAAVAHQTVAYDEPVDDMVVEASRWNPRVGIAARLTPTTLLRAAAFRQLNINIFGSAIAPPTVAGFVVARNEFPTAERREVNVSLEQALRRTFVGVRVFRRKSEIEYLERSGSSLAESDARSTGGSLYLNLIATERVTLFGEDQWERFNAREFRRFDNAVRGGVQFIHPRGLFVRSTATHITQRFDSRSITGLPSSDFTLVDLNVSYEFAQKRGRLTFEAYNVLRERFQAVIENLTVGQFVPRRRIIASLGWRLWSR